MCVNEEMGLELSHEFSPRKGLELGEDMYYWHGLNVLPSFCVLGLSTFLNE